ncbi:hypothetical protein [Falsarthrobacter nasiphocae]|uniref:Htaa domain-containing protein n=1 Tax=Falsarthrobacter nasiphocae TaxID=189863 RepID=A0AAE3YG24_9MICC|nr:hypothetical protein [Falsarthrobacter nasiphocae]MDR6891515.1 hypothetical protein [Falsarthrobacter nasiphocae]
MVLPADIESSASASPRPALGRRRVLTAAAWSAPVVAIAGAAPSTAASVPAREISIAMGAFAQVVDTQRDNPDATILGVTSYGSGTVDPTGTLSSSTGFSAKGSGTFTPGGSVPPGPDGGTNGGVGFFFSAPRFTDTGEFVPGTSTLEAGAVVSMVVRAAFAPGEAYEPLLWRDGASTLISAQPSGGTALREGLNGVPFTAMRANSALTDDSWTGTVLVTTTGAVTVTGPESPYVQLLASHVPVYWQEHGPTSVTVTLSVQSGTVTTDAVPYAPTTHSLAGLRAEATL